MPTHVSLSRCAVSLHWAADAGASRGERSWGGRPACGRQARVGGGGVGGRRTIIVRQLAAMSPRIQWSNHACSTSHMHCLRGKASRSRKSQAFWAYLGAPASLARAAWSTTAMNCSVAVASSSSPTGRGDSPPSCEAVAQGERRERQRGGTERKRSGSEPSVRGRLDRTHGWERGAQARRASPLRKSSSPRLASLRLPPPPTRGRSAVRTAATKGQQLVQVFLSAAEPLYRAWRAPPRGRRGDGGRDGWWQSARHRRRHLFVPPPRRQPHSGTLP